MRGQSVGDEAVYGEGAEESAEDDTVEAADALTCWGGLSVLPRTRTRARRRRSPEGDDP